MAHSNTNPVIEVRDLKKWFPLRGSFFSSLFGKGEIQYLKAVDGVNFRIQPGEVLGSAKGMWDYMQSFFKGGTEFLMDFAKEAQGHPIANFHQFIGFPEVRRLEEEYLPSEEIERKYARSIGYQP